MSCAHRQWAKLTCLQLIVGWLTSSYKYLMQKQNDWEQDQQYRKTIDLKDERDNEFWMPLKKYGELGRYRHVILLKLLQSIYTFFSESTKEVFYTQGVWRPSKHALSIFHWETSYNLKTKRHPLSLRQLTGAAQDNSVIWDLRMVLVPSNQTKSNTVSNPESCIKKSKKIPR